ncbi:MAG: hypothetical protein KatS3mg124_1046 [Porticoccaceae bacterium]|nr:MAG: hypothetical protein KatS3mg124_1046 [Porticoccaceae bacterium]
MACAALFATCAVDLLRPQVAEAGCRLVRAAGWRLEVPPQGCCGQVAWNNGEIEAARRMARRVMDRFGGADRVVVPSASCAATMRLHYPTLFDGAPRARQFAQRVRELSEFLVEVEATPPAARRPRRVAWQEGCSARRELQLGGAPRALLARAGHQVLEIAEAEVCCGFGGTFCVKFPEIADRMAEDKARRVLEVHPEVLSGTDLPCLLHVGGKLSRLAGGDAIEVSHLAELLDPGESRG